MNEIKVKTSGINIVYDGIKLRTMYGNDKPEGSSIDSWIFETPFDFSDVNFDIEFGTFACDSLMNYQLSKIRKVVNPCLSIISIHKHLGWYPCYQQVNFNGQNLNWREYLKIMNKKGIKVKE